MIRRRLGWTVRLGGFAIASALMLGAGLAPAADGETGIAAAAATRPVLRRYVTPYYIIHTDLDEKMVREAAIRMTAMGAEYARRVRGFGPKVDERLDFYLFSHKADYHAAGGPEGSYGIYDGRRKLMAVAEKGYSRRLWYLIQHEGFHQFFGWAMRSDIPVWLNEGLAEYFGEGIWTGDGFVMGDVPTNRVRRIRASIKAGKMRYLDDMLKMSHKTWNAQMDTGNYDQAWAIVHFLIHGQGGEYRQAFGKFLTDVGKGGPWAMSFTSRLGRDTRALGKQCEQWWLSLPANPAAEVRAKAVTQTLTSFLARAVAQRQRIENFDGFVANAAAGKLACRDDQWLPPTLLTRALAASRRYTTWEIKRTRVYPSLVLRDAENVYTGTFSVQRGRAAKVTVTVTPAPKNPH